MTQVRQQLSTAHCEYHDSSEVNYLTLMCLPALPFLRAPNQCLTYVVLLDFPAVRLGDWLYKQIDLDTFSYSGTLSKRNVVIDMCRLRAR